MKASKLSETTDKTTKEKEKVMEESKHPLAHLIPSKAKWSENGAYISREIG